jgi:glycosyltransferase involved in cell wall biosynthesis
VRLLLVTNGLNYGGAERVVEALALHFHAKGTPLHVVAVTRGGPIADLLREKGVGVSVLSIKSPLDVTASIKLARVARRFGADLIHSHLEVSDIVVALASPAIRTAKTITTVHNLGAGLAASAWKRTLWKQAVPRFDRVLAVSGAVAERVPVEATILRPSVISKDRPQPDRARMRRLLGVQEDEKVVLAVGRLTWEKGFDLLGRAAERLAAIGARVMVIGDGPDREALLRHAHLELLGSRQDAGDLMAAADVVACPSRTEGFPQVPLQAMFAGVPVVGTAAGGMSEVVDERSGIVVPPEDPEALAGAIASLISDPARARALGANGRARIFEDGLTSEAMCARHEEIYREMLR